MDFDSPFSRWWRVSFSHDDPALAKLGGRIRSARKKLGWSQEQFADEAGLDRSYVGAIERGQRNISFLILCKIVEALNCDVAALTKSIPAPAAKVEATRKA